MKKFDAIVIGSGQGGTPLSKRLANAGWKTALVEKKFIGGTCVNVGCTPTKAMVASARMAYLSSTSNNLGINIPSFSVDLPAIVERKNGIVKQFRDGSKQGLEATKNLTLFFGEAIFTGEKEIRVDLNDGTEEQLTAEKIFIDTGARATIPNIEGINTIPYLTSSTILDLTKVPEHLLIIGAGYIACEFGQMFRRFGSKVTLLERSKDFLPKEDRDIADCLAAILREEKISIYTDVIIQKLQGDKGNINATIQVAGKATRLSCSHILIATGRTPETKQLNLKVTGVETNERGYIKVDDKLKTTQEGIYALGDVNGGPAFTHISYNDYVIISKNLLEDADASTKRRPVPYCMFTDPQFGRFGLSEKDAEQKGLNFKVASLGMGSVARGVETGETKGMIKAIVDSNTKQILGAAVIGEQGGEIMSMLQLAMMGNLGYDQLKDTIFAHPLYAESLNNLFMKLE